ncbi:DNA replication and repair protein RecF [Fibrobacterales bacterium]|nr:DNA replication and repair protein RecF [Fibrobacterales bacterium]
MLLSLSQENFRNLKRFSFEFSQGITVISGQNGHGKTNLLEAAHTICQGFSFRTRNLQDAINWNSENFILRGITAGTDGSKSESAIQVAKDITKVKLNGKEFRRATALFGNAPTVTLSPEDIELVRGSPENRRNYLDELLCHQKKNNIDLLRKYRRVLQQRNKWLRDNLAGIDCGGEDLYFALTEQLVSLAVQVWNARAELCKIIAPLINDFYRQLASSTEFLTFLYNKNLSAEEFSKALTAKFAAERASGSTLAGPHKDDVEFTLHNHSVRENGSQGQCRSLALAMRLAAAELIESECGIKPILLLDDIFAELDSSRRGAIAEIVRNKQCQVFAATPRKEDLPFTGDCYIDVRDGCMIV